MNIFSIFCTGAADDIVSTAIAGVGVRKDVSTLSESEIENLRDALRKVQEDTGPNGFQVSKRVSTITVKTG